MQTSQLARESRPKQSLTGALVCAHVQALTHRSLETWVSLAVPGAGVGLGVGLLDASTCAEMSLGLTHSGSSKKERVGAYYNYIYILDIEKKKDSERLEVGVYLRAIS